VRERISFYRRERGTSDPEANSLETVGTRTGVPPKWAGHQSVCGRVFYSLPAKLLDAIWPVANRSRNEVRDIEMEVALGSQNGDHSSRVGFIDGNPVPFGFLCEPRLDAISLKYLDDVRTKFGEASVKGLEDRLKHSHRGIRSYSGWLMTNPTFLAEHAKVWDEIRALVKRDSLMPSPAAAGTVKALGLARETKTKAVGQLRALAEFCSRWRLSRLAGPMLPEPLGIQMPALLPQLAAVHAAASGYFLAAIFSWPFRTRCRCLRRRHSDKPWHRRLRRWKRTI
jgi:hypothetical protein